MQGVLPSHDKNWKYYKVIITNVSFFTKFSASIQSPFLPFELTNLKMADELSEETLKEAFESADKDKDSQISVSELGKYLH